MVQFAVAIPYCRHRFLHLLVVNWAQQHKPPGTPKRKSREYFSHEVIAYRTLVQLFLSLVGREVALVNHDTELTLSFVVLTLLYRYKPYRVPTIEHY